jgi:hypothetical protein
MIEIPFNNKLSPDTRTIQLKAIHIVTIGTNKERLTRHITNLKIKEYGGN